MDSEWDIPIRISVGNINSGIIGSVTEYKAQALAGFLRAFANEIEGGTDESTDRIEPSGRQGTPEIE